MKNLTFILVALTLILLISTGCSQLKGSILKKIPISGPKWTLTIVEGDDQNGGKGSVNPGYGKFIYKDYEEVIVTATADPGSVFVGWQGIDGVLPEMSAVDPSKPSSGKDYKIDVMMKRDVTLVALFVSATNTTTRASPQSVPTQLAKPSVTNPPNSGGTVH